jgi:hypothetical protein
MEYIRLASGVGHQAAAPEAFLIDIPKLISVIFSNDILPSSQLTYNQYTILDLFGGLKYFFTFDTVLIEAINRTSVFINDEGVISVFAREYSRKF